MPFLDIQLTVSWQQKAWSQIWPWWSKLLQSSANNRKERILGNLSIYVTSTRSLKDLERIFAKMRSTHGSWSRTNWLTDWPGGETSGIAADAVVDFGDSERRRFSSSSKLVDKLLDQPVDDEGFDVLERFDFPFTAFSSSTPLWKKAHFCYNISHNTTVTLIPKARICLI